MSFRLFFSLFLFLNSCNWYGDCSKIYVSNTFAQWGECYNEGDTIILKSIKALQHCLYLKPFKCIRGTGVKVQLRNVKCTHQSY